MSSRRVLATFKDVSIDSLAIIETSVGITGDNMRLAISGSNLGGNEWHGFVSVLTQCGEEIKKHQIRCTSGCGRLTTNQNTIVVGMDNGYFNVYSHDLKELDSVSAHDDIVSGLSFSVNTSHFYSCGWDGAIIVWDIADYKEPLYVIQDAHSSAVYDISSHPSQGNIFVSVGYDGFCRLWDVRQGKDAFNLVNVGQIASSVTFTSDLYLSCGLVDGMIKQFDIRDLTEPSSQLKLEGNIRRLETPQQFPSKLIASTGNMECCILNTDPILSVIHRYVGHTDFVNDFVLVSNLEGNEDKLYTVSVDGELHCSSVHK